MVKTSMGLTLAAFLALCQAAGAQTCPVPAPSDAGKFCRANADGTATWSSAIVEDISHNILNVVPNIISKSTTGVAFQCGVNNVGCLAQVDKLGATRNIFYMDNAQNSVLGATHDKGAYSILTYNGFNFFLNDTTYNFEGTSFPPANLVAYSVGRGYSVSPGGDNNMLITSSANGNGDGVLIMATNRLTNISYPSQTTFLNAVSDDTYVDLQFGLRDESGDNQIRFRVGSGASGHATLDCTVTNRLRSHTISWPAYERGTDRRVFKLFIPPTNAGEKIALRPGDSNNEYVDASPACEFDFNDLALPDRAANLKPFVMFRNYDQASSRMLNLGKIEFQSGF